MMTKSMVERVWAEDIGQLLYHLDPGGARGVVVIAVGNEQGDTSSNPGRD